MRSKDQVIDDGVVLHGGIEQVRWTTNELHQAMDLWAKELCVKFYHWANAHYNRIADSNHVEQLFNQFLQEIKQDK